MHENEADKIIAVRKNAPLIIGLGEGEIYCQRRSRHYRQSEANDLS